MNGSTRGMVLEIFENRVFFFKILDLVDRYWNGFKFFYKYVKFKGYIVKLINLNLFDLNNFYVF